MAINRKDGTAAGEPKRLTNWTGFTALWLSATSDGKRLAFIRQFSRGHTYIASLKRDDSGIGELRRLTHDEWDDSPTAWSSDDRFVYFSTDRNGSQDILRQAIGQESPEPVAVGPGDQGGCRTTPDGKWVLVVASSSVPGEKVRILRIPAAGGPGEVIAETPALVHHRCGERAGCVMVELVGDDDVIYELDPMKDRGSELFRKPPGSGDPAVSPRRDPGVPLRYQPHDPAGLAERCAHTGYPDRR